MMVERVGGSPPGCESVRSAKKVTRRSRRRRSATRHVAELPGDVDVELAQELQRRQVPLGDAGDGDVEEIELVLLHEVKEKVERTLEGRLAGAGRRQRHLEGRQRHPLAQLERRV